MSCEEYNRNFTESMLLMQANISTAGHATTKSRVILFHVILPVILIFGIVGNILNLLILTRKQLKRTMDRMEKSVHVGLVALAASDLLFCILSFPKSVTQEVFTVTEDRKTPLLHYQVYYEPFLNTFIMSSTWLTVTMALGRYVAICHPLHARWLVDMRATKIIISGVFVLSILFNLPGFWRYYIIVEQCATHCKCYSIAVGSLYTNATFKYGYGVAWALIGCIIPVVILAFCNVCLIRALQQSRRMRRLFRANHTQHDDSGRARHISLSTNHKLVFICHLQSQTHNRKLDFHIPKSKKHYLRWIS